MPCHPYPPLTHPHDLGFCLLSLSFWRRVFCLAPLRWCRGSNVCSLVCCRQVRQASFSLFSRPHLMMKQACRPLLLSLDLLYRMVARTRDPCHPLTLPPSHTPTHVPNCFPMNHPPFPVRQESRSSSILLCSRLKHTDMHCLTTNSRAIVSTQPLAGSLPPSTLLAAFRLSYLFSFICPQLSVRMINYKHVI